VLLRGDERREEESRQERPEDEHSGIVQPEKRKSPTLSADNVDSGADS
jgi:hypothetical protein